MHSQPGHGSLSSNDCLLHFFFNELDILISAGLWLLFDPRLHYRAKAGEDLEDVLQWGVVYHVFALDVDQFLACLRVVGLGLADSELGEATESCLEDLDQAGVHVFDDSIIMQTLDAQVQLAQ